MKVSVVIPSYNCIDLLKITMASLENQDIAKEDFEVIVVDDGSKDDTSTYLKSYNGPLKLKTVINPANMGRAISRNRGLAVSTNELIVFLDADIEASPDLLRLHLQAQEKGACACVGKIVYHPGLEINRLMGYLDRRGSAKADSGSVIPGKYFRTTNASAPLSVIREAGFFDENFVQYGGEDTELGIRLEKKIPVYSLPEAVGYNRHWRELGELLDIMEVYGEKSLPYLFTRHPEFRKEMKLEHVNKKTPFNLIASVCCSTPVYGFLRFLAKNDMAPDMIYTYLLYRSTRAGFIKSTKNKHSEVHVNESVKLNPTVK